jgi:cell shape-determining protein MreC
MTLEEIERLARNKIPLSDIYDVFDRLLELVLEVKEEEANELKELLEDNFNLAEEIESLKEKVTELEEYKYMYESVSK